MDVVAVLAQGNPGWPLAPGHWDLTPVVVAVVALLVLRAGLGVRLRPLVVLGAFLLAPVFTMLGDAFGYPLVGLISFALVTVAVFAIRRAHPR